MAEEVFTIRLEEAAGVQGPPAPPAPVAPSPPASNTPIPPAANLKEFNPEVEAKKLIELEQRRNQILEARSRIMAEQMGMQQKSIEEETKDRIKQLQDKQKVDWRKRVVDDEAKKYRPDLFPEEKKEVPKKGPGLGDILQSVGMGGIGGIIKAIENAVGQARKPVTTKENAPFYYEAFRDIPAPRKPNDVPKTTENAANNKTPVQNTPIPPANKSPEPPTQDFTPAPSTVTAAAPAEAAEGAEGLMAGLAGAAAALAPFVAAIIAVDLAARLVAKGLNTVNEMMTKETQAVSMAIKGDNFGALIKHVDNTAEALGKIPIAGQVLEAGMKLATGGVKAFKETIDSVIARGHELAKFSGDISAAFAIANVRQIQGDIKEAQKTGPDIASIINSSSEMDNSLREIFLPIKEFITSELAGFMKEFSGILKDLVPLFKGIFTVATTIAEVALAPLKYAVEILGKILHAVTDILRWIGIYGEEEKKSKGFNWKNDIDTALGKMSDWSTIDNDAVKKAAGTKLNMPAFKGAW